MIAYLKGTVEEISADNAVIEVNNIGYNVKISDSTASLLGGRKGQVKLYTYTLVREDAFNLFGFLSKDELELFKLLLTVNGVGPKGALGVLSAIPANDLRFAIAAGDYKTIQRAPGIGKRTAERIILDLRDRISDSISDLSDGLGFSEVLSDASADKTDNAIKNEVLEALVALGYSGQEAMKAISKVSPEDSTDAGVMLKAALKYIY